MRTSETGPASGEMKTLAGSARAIDQVNVDALRQIESAIMEERRILQIILNHMQAGSGSSYTSSGDAAGNRGKGYSR